MAKDLEAGTSLPEAYAKQKEQLPGLYQALIRVGIASGDLPAVLDEIARHAGERAEVAARLRKALFYPMVSGIGVLAVGLVAFLCLGPMIRELYVPSFSPTRATLWDYAPWFLMGSLALVPVFVFAFTWFRNPLDSGVGPRSFFFRFPFVGRLRAYAAKAGFASTMAMLLKRNLPLPESLELAAAATNDTEVADQIRSMRTSAETGENLSDSVRSGDLISPAMLWFVEAGEATGTPASSLADVAKVYQQRLERAVDRLCFFVNPAALLLVGLVVVSFSIICLRPMYEAWRGLMGG